MRILRILAIVQIACLLMASTSSAVYAKPVDVLGETIQIMVGGKEKTIGYVKDIKAKYKEDAPEYIAARDKYRDALDKYNGWAAAVKIAILAGKTKNLSKDDSYKKMAESAGKAGREFIAYVQSKTGTPKALLPFLKELVDLGLKVWKSVKDREDAKRKTIADEFAKNVIWPQWEEIKVQ